MKTTDVLKITSGLRSKLWVLESKLRWRTPLLAAGYAHATALVVMAIKNRVFTFADMLLFLPCFPDFQHSF